MANPIAKKCFLKFNHIWTILERPQESRWRSRWRPPDGICRREDEEEIKKSFCRRFTSLFIQNALWLWCNPMSQGNFIINGEKIQMSVGNILDCFQDFPSSNQSMNLFFFGWICIRDIERHWFCQRQGFRFGIARFFNSPYTSKALNYSNRIPRKFIMNQPCHRFVEGHPLRMLICHNQITYSLRVIL